MKTVQSTWRNLAAGHQKVGQLEVELRTQWQPRVEEAHQRKVQTELAEWESRRRQRAQEHRHALSTWTQTVAEEQELLRTNVGSDVRRARLAVPASIVVFIVAALLEDGIDQLPLIILLGICVGAGIAFAPTARRAIQIAGLKSRKPLAPSDDAKPLQDPVLKLSLVDRWWHEISDDGRLTRAASEYGNEGEERFFRYLKDVLPDDHFGTRSILVKRRLDNDSTRHPRVTERSFPYNSD